MSIKNQIIVITGGASGIGYAIIKELVATNTIISLDRNEQKISRLQASLPKVVSIQTDITDQKQVDQSLKLIGEQFGRIDILINNAGKGSIFSFSECQEEKLEAILRLEMETNYMAPVLLTKKAISLLERSTQPMLVFITSGLAYMPIAEFASYCASKSAMHFFTMALRHQLKNTKISVLEVLPPTVDTEFNKGMDVPKISAQKFASKLVSLLSKNKLTINIGQSAALEKFARLFPGLAFRMLNKT